MPAGFAVSWDGLDDVIRGMEQADVHQAYGIAATDAAELAASDMQTRGRAAGVPERVLDRIGPSTDDHNVIGIASRHPEHDRYEYGDLDTQPTGFWGSAMKANDDYDPTFHTVFAAELGLA